jgi:hypothetical protein
LSFSTVYLEFSFFLDKVKVAIWEYDSNKALGPNGVGFFFIKKAWDIIISDILNMDDFYLLGVLPHSF